MISTYSLSKLSCHHLLYAKLYISQKKFEHPSKNLTVLYSTPSNNIYNPILKTILTSTLQPLLSNPHTNTRGKETEMDKADLASIILLSTLFGIPILGGLFLFCVYVFGFCSTFCSCSSRRYKPRFDANADAALDFDPELDLEFVGGGNGNGAFHQGATSCGCGGSGKTGNTTSFMEMPLPPDRVYCPVV